MAQKFVTPVTIRNLTSASSDGLAVSVDGDTNDRIKVEAGGRLVWGSGSATGDANLYRSGVGAVKTDHTFEAESGVITLTSSGAPTSTIADGAIAVDTTNSKFYYRSNSAWNTISGGATVSTTAPSNPSEGDIWFDSNTGDTLVYYGSVWVDVGGSSVANIAVQTTAPSNPVNGDLWFDTDTAKTYVWYDDGTSAQWVEVGAASAAASGTDGAVQFASGGTFSSDASNLVWDDTNNRLGIGTTTPSQPLHVQGNALIESGGLTVNAGGNTVLNRAGASASTAAGGLEFQIDGTTYASLHQPSAGSLSTSANVGIGTTTPAASLTVTSGTDDAKVKIDSNGGSVGTIDATANTNDATGRWLSINPSGGNVGIGTTTPTNTLDVNGAINTTSKYLRSGKATGDTLIASGALGSSGVAITSVFSGDYSNYRILLTFKHSSGSEVYYRMMNGGAWYTTSVYETQRLYAQGTSVGAVRTQANSYGRVGYSGGYWSSAEMTVYHPYVSTRETNVASHEVYSDNYYRGMVEFDHSQVATTTSFDGIFIGPASGATMYGSYWVYGIAE